MLRHSLLLALICLLPSIDTLAQSASEDFEKAKALNEAGKLDSSKFYFERASESYKAQGDESGYFDSQMRLMEVLNSQRLFSRLRQKTNLLLSELNKSDQARPEHFAQINLKLGAMEEMQQGDMGSALNYYKKGLSYYEENSQDKPHLVFSKLWKESGLMYGYMQQTDTSRAYLAKALAILARHYPEQVVEKVDIMSLRAMTYYFEYNPNKARAELRTAMEVLDAQETTRNVQFIRSTQYSMLTEIFLMGGYYDSALFFLDKRKALEESISQKLTSIQAQIAMQQAKIHGLKGDLRQAISGMEKAIDMLLQVFGPDYMLTAQSYTLLAQYIQSNNGALTEAEEFLNKALGSYEKIYGPDHAGTGVILLNIGNIHLQTGDYAKALQYYRQAQEIQIKNKAEVQVEELNDLMGETYLEMGEYQLALEVTATSSDTYSRVYYPEHEYVAGVHVLRAKALKGLNQLNQALQELEKAEKIYQKSLGQRHQKIADLHYNRSLIYESKGEINTSLKWIQKAMMCNSYQFNSENIQQNPEPGDFISTPDMLRYLSEKARFLNSATSDRASQLASQRLYDLAINAMDEMLKDQNNNKDVSSINEVYRNIYDASLHNLSKLYEIEKSDELKEKMLLTVGEAKSRALQLNHSHKKAQAYANLPQSVLAQEQEALNEIAYTQSRLLDTLELTETLKKYFEDRLFYAKREKEKLMTQLENDHPDYYQLKYERNLSDSKTIQQNLKPDEAYLEYHQANNKLYTFIITKDLFEIHRTEIPQDFDSLIAQFNTAIRSKQTDSYQETGQKIHELVLSRADVLKKATKIFILPDRALWAVNFDLLPTPDEATDYLIEHYAFSYGYSAALLFDKDRKKRSNNKMLAFSYQNSSAGGVMSLENMRNSELSDLPGTAQEIHSLSEIIAGDYYYGSEAREAVFKDKAADYAILHLALHGKVDYQNSDNSKLYFADQEGQTGSAEDELLYPFELYNMNLSADLAVLSACETGAGKITNGEGIMSLGRAFQYAGVKSLLLSQWEVSDPVSPVIMTSFYTNLKAGMNKAEALRQAKLSFLRTADNVAANPYYWGGFFILGNTEPVAFGAHQYKTIMVSLAFVILVCLMMIRRRKKSDS